jgi:lysozyme
MLIPGFDVSRYEVVTDWNNVRLAGYPWGSTRATVGDYYTDPTFEAYWKGMKDTGILRMAYHVIAPWRPKEQINRFIELIKDDKGELPPVLDLERFGGEPYDDAWWKVNKAKTTECVRHAVVEIQTRLGRTPVIYTTQSFYFEFMRRLPVIEACPLWVANYTTRPEPAMPVGWDKWMFWQYSDGGKIAGITGATDLNWFNGSLEELNLMAGVVGGGVDDPLEGHTLDEAVIQLAKMHPGMWG